MKKSLIGLAVASAFTATSAFADSANVTIYGKANVSFNVVDNGNIRTNHVASNASALGLKGKEDLGNGTAAIWQIETAISTDGTTNANINNSWASRNTFVGLSGDSWGTITLGRRDTPYKSATRSYDLFADTIADNRTLMGQTNFGTYNHNARWNNSVNYISPTLEGVTIEAAYSAAAENVFAANDAKGNGYSLAAAYNKDALKVSLAYQTIKGGTAGTGAITPILPANDKAKALNIGGSYGFDAFLITASYEKLKSSGTLGNSFNQNNWYVGGKYSITNNDAIKLAYTKAGKINNIANSGASQVSVGYDHGLSKRTTVYALYTRLSNKSGVGYSLGYNDATTNTVLTPVGKNASAFSLGLKHNF